MSCSSFRELILFVVCLVIIIEYIVHTLFFILATGMCPPCILLSLFYVFLFVIGTRQQESEGGGDCFTRILNSRSKTSHRHKGTSTYTW